MNIKELIKKGLWKYLFIIPNTVNINRSTVFLPTEIPSFTLDRKFLLLSVSKEFLATPPPYCSSFTTIVFLTRLLRFSIKEVWRLLKLSTDLFRLRRPSPLRDQTSTLRSGPRGSKLPTAFLGAVSRWIRIYLSEAPGGRGLKPMYNVSITEQ